MLSEVNFQLLEKFVTSNIFLSSINVTGLLSYLLKNLSGRWKAETRHSFGTNSFSKYLFPTAQRPLPAVSLRQPGSITPTRRSGH